MKIQVIDASNPLWSETLEETLSHDFYHLPDYAALEARWIKAVPEAIRIEQGDRLFFLPYLLRQCSPLFAESPSDVFDVVSPYGYPGVLINDAAAQDAEFLNQCMQALLQTFRDRHICSAFVRLHPILNQQFADQYEGEGCSFHSETVSVDLTLPAEEIWRQTRPEHRNKINKCKRAGFQAQVVPVETGLKSFMEIYTETMDRVGASQFYYFDDEYFLQLAQALGDRLHICQAELDGQVACAGLFTECSGIVQYHLGGTRNAFLKQSPMTLLFDFVRSWAKERGNTSFHLGGGVGGAQDSLMHFKAGFSHQRQRLFLLRLVVDPSIYQFLVELRAKSLNTSAEQLLDSTFFPAYRSLDTEVSKATCN